MIHQLKSFREKAFQIHHHRVFPWLAILLVFWLYAGIMQSPYLLDDLDMVANNPHIRISGFWLDQLLQAAFDSPAPNRPVANLSFALNYYLDGYRVAGYHLLNVLVHLAAGLSLFGWLRRTLMLPAVGYRAEKAWWIAFGACLLWLVHPVQTQAVTYIVQRMTSMAAMFYVLCLLLYVQGRLAPDRWAQVGYFGGCVLAGVLALGTKEIAATLPFFIVLYEWYFFQDLRWQWLKRRLPVFMGLLVFMVLLALLYVGGDPVGRILGGYAVRDFTLAQRLLTQLRVVVFYMGLLLYPHPSRLNLDHDFALSYSWTEPVTTLLAAGLLAVLAVLAVVLARRQRLLSFAILWFLGNLVIESSVVNLEMVFEHRLYLPSMLAAVPAVAWLWGRVRARSLAAAFMAVLVLVSAMWTQHRNAVWSNDMRLWADCANKSPQKARPYNNLGEALARRGLYLEARKCFLKSIELEPGHADAHNNMGAVLAMHGELSQAIVYFKKALEIDPGFYDAAENLKKAMSAKIYP